MDQPAASLADVAAADLPTIAFLRHGETDWNRDGRLQGQRDVPLNELGRSQARRNGELLAAELLGVAEFDFVASPLLRTRDTMELARTSMGLPAADYRLDDRLKEITFGDWEGFTYGDIARKFPEGAAARAADKYGFVPPGGESYRQLGDRVAPVLASLTRPTVMVAHGGVARVLRILLLGEAPEIAVATDIRHDRALIWEHGQVRIV